MGMSCRLNKKRFHLKNDNEIKGTVCSYAALEYAKDTCED